MNRKQHIALLVLVGIMTMAWGFASARRQFFPYNQVVQIARFIKGAQGETVSLSGMILSDLGISPRRAMRDYPDTAIKNAKPLAVPGLKDRREKPLCYLSPEARQGYRAIFGAFDFEDTFHGGILLDPDGKVVHTWKLSTSHLPGNMEPDERKILYGLAMYSDGSVIFHNQEDGGGIVKVNAQSKEIWNLDGKFHHDVTPTDRDSFWSFHGDQEDFHQDLVEIDARDGHIIRTIHMDDVRHKNPGANIFDLRTGVVDGEAGLKQLANRDALHANDVDPLTEERAAYFPMFKPGDLLISYLGVNLVFVLDPESLEIKWYRIGAWARQHDPDWETDGRIVVFSNNSSTPRKYSDIIAVDPKSLERTVVLDGEPLGFRSMRNGRHERTGFNTRLVTSSDQGWVFEVDDSNELVFSFANVFSQADKKSLHVAHAYHVEKDFFTKDFISQWEKP